MRYRAVDTNNSFNIVMLNPSLDNPYARGFGNAIRDLAPRER